jgi:hypothetical protein
MRRVVYFGALVTLMALTSTPVSAQTSGTMPSRTGDGTWHVKAMIGPSFGTLGSAPTSVASAGVVIGGGWSLVGEAGAFRGRPVEQKALVPLTSPVAPPTTLGRSNIYHFNANLLYRAPEVKRMAPYFTAGAGTFRSAVYTAGTPVPVGLSGFERKTHAATNVGAGVTWRANRWIGVGADYRLFVFNTNGAPRVNRFTTGVSINLR